MKMADVFGIEKVWSGEYEACRKHGDFTSLRSTQRIRITFTVVIVRDEELSAKVVGRTQQRRILSIDHSGDHESNAPTRSREGPSH